MNNIDMAVLIVCAISTLVGLARGLIASLFSTFGWIMAILLNHYLFQSIEPFLEAKFHSKLITFSVGYVGVLILMLLLFSILNFVLVSTVQRFTVGYIDKFAGACFGLARGALLVIIGFLCFDTVASILWGEKASEMMPDQLVHATTLPLMKRGETILLKYLPKNFKSNLSFYAADLRNENISDMELMNLVRKLGKSAPSHVVDDIDANQKYMSKRQSLIAKIAELWEYHQQHGIDSNLSDEETQIIKSIS